jgi:hypothetical protein
MRRLGTEEDRGARDHVQPSNSSSSKPEPEAYHDGHMGGAMEEHVIPEAGISHESENLPQGLRKKGIEFGRHFVM